MSVPAKFVVPAHGARAGTTADRITALEEAMADPDYAGPCPKCGGVFTLFRMGHAGEMESVSYRECDECGLQWDQT